MKEYTAVVSSAADGIIHALEPMFDVVSLPSDPVLQAQVSSHPDMLLFDADGHIFVPLDYYKRNDRQIDMLSDRCLLSVIKTTGERRADYPFDISHNVLLCGKYAFSLKARTAPEIKVHLSENGYIHKNVKQGYSACSSLSTNNFVVTADASIEKICRECGIDVLRISQGGISLPGYDTGFIGGCTGVCDGVVYFTGSLKSHTDEKNIREFLSSHGYSCVSLTEGLLTDVGGIKFFKNKS